MEDHEISTSENGSISERIDSENMDVDQTPALVKNRRYNKMMELMESGDFFNEDNIKMMEPLLYYMYIGKHKRNGQVKSSSPFTVKDVCIQQLDEKVYENKLFEEYQSKPDYFDGAEEEGMEVDANPEPEQLMKDPSTCQPDVDIEDNEDELIRIIMKKFVDGKLSHAINYDLIDNCPQYDDHKQIQRDQEDKYFDSEQPSDGVENSVYTGEQDF